MTDEKDYMGFWTQSPEEIAAREAVKTLARQQRQREREIDEDLRRVAELEAAEKRRVKELNATEARRVAEEIISYCGMPRRNYSSG